jgi:hypothetical protein
MEPDRAASDLARAVIKTFPENRDMQLVCLRVSAEFRCTRCTRTRRATLLAVVAGDWNRLVCKDCYQKALAEPAAPPEPKPKGEEEEPSCEE